MAEKDKDLQKIKKLIEIMKDNELAEVEIKHGDDKILLRRTQPGQQIINAMPMVNPAAAAPAGEGAAGLQPIPQQSQDEQKHLEGITEIKSPIVGTFYSQPNPDSEPYVEAGSQVSPQTMVCIIEAMKVMNEIKAQVSGTVTEVLVKNGQAVEYDQPLFRVKTE